MSEANSNDLDARIAAFDPTDPEALAALERDIMGQGEPPKPESNPADTAAAPAPKKDDTTAAPQDEKKADTPAANTQTEKADPVAPSGDQKPEGVQAKDGRHVIPYQVLERERTRASQAEAALRTLTAEVEQLKSGKATDAAAPALLSEEDLAALDQDLPSVAKAIRAQMAMIDALTGTVTQLKGEQSAVVQNQQRTVEDELEAAINGNPDLSAWRNAAFREDNPDPLMWNRARNLDAALQNDPEWQNKTFAERFAKVTETMKALYGIAGAAPSTDPKPQPTAADLKQAAEAKLKEAPAPVPTSLSDIPGGNPPAQSHLEQLENASGISLTNRFLSMTPDQIEAELARLGT